MRLKKDVDKLLKEWEPDAVERAIENECPQISEEVKKYLKTSNVENTIEHFSDKFYELTDGKDLQKEFASIMCFWDYEALDEVFGKLELSEKVYMEAQRDMLDDQGCTVETIIEELNEVYETYF